jgi:hypothetical protein
MAGMRRLALRSVFGIVASVAAGSAGPGVTQPAMTQMAVSASSPIALSTTPTRISLSGTHELLSHPETFGPDRKIYLVITGLHASAQPGVVYNVFLLPPASGDERLSPESPYLAGTLNFFAASDLAPGRPAGQRPRISFDVTSIVRTMRANGHPLDGASVVVSPAGKPDSSAKPTIESVALIGQ